jgi:hypothetical protein
MNKIIFAFINISKRFQTNWDPRGGGGGGTGSSLSFSMIKLINFSLYDLRQGLTYGLKQDTPRVRRATSLKIGQGSFLYLGMDKLN